MRLGGAKNIAFRDLCSKTSTDAKGGAATTAAPPFFRFVLEIKLVLNQVRKFDLDQIMTLGLTIAGAAIMIGGIRLKIGTVSVPEPGFFPFISGAGVAALSMRRLIASRSRKSDGGEVGESIDGWWKAVALAAALIVYTLILDWLGFTVATSLLAIAVMRIARPQSWISTIAISIALAVICQYLFGVLLKVSLPAGTYSF